MDNIWLNFYFKLLFKNKFKNASNFIGFSTLFKCIRLSLGWFTWRNVMVSQRTFLPFALFAYMSWEDNTKARDSPYWY